MGIFDRFRKSSKESAPASPPMQAMNAGTSSRLERMMAPFEAPASGFYSEEYERSKKEALQKVVAEGSEGEVFLLQYMQRNTTMSGGYFLLAAYGDAAHGEWIKKRDMVLALSHATSPAIVSKLKEILLCKGKEPQFAVILQPSIVETLGELKAYDALQSFVASGQDVPALLLSKDILRLYTAGAVDKPENQRDEKGYAPLHLASSKGDTAEVERLLAAGADVDIVCSRGESIGQTALYMAVISKHLDVVKLLIAGHANMSAPDLYGSFPLQRAAAMGLADIARVLVENGADKRQQTRTGKTALTWAEQNGHQDIAALLR